MRNEWLFRKVVLPALVVLALAAFVQCESAAHQRLPTGVERIDQANGGIRLVATAMASQKAIDGDRTAMMQATSREAARLLLLAELKKPEYSAIRDRFETGEVEFIERGLYCRMVSTYSPPVPPVTPVAPGR